MVKPTTDQQAALVGALAGVFEARASMASADLREMRHYPTLIQCWGKLGEVYKDLNNILKGSREPVNPVTDTT